MLQVATCQAQTVPRTHMVVDHRMLGPQAASSAVGCSDIWLIACDIACLAPQGACSWFLISALRVGGRKLGGRVLHGCDPRTCRPAVSIFAILVCDNSDDHWIRRYCCCEHYGATDRHFCDVVRWVHLRVSVPIANKGEYYSSIEIADTSLELFTASCPISIKPRCATAKTWTT